MMEHKIFLIWFVIIIGTFVSYINAEEKTFNLQTRGKEGAESNALEQELKRVKRIQNGGDMLERVKRLNPDSIPTLSRVKRIKRSLQHVKDVLDEAKKKSKFEEKPSKGKGKIFRKKSLYRAKRIERKYRVQGYNKEHKLLNDEKFGNTSQTKLNLHHLLSLQKGKKQMMKHRKLLNNKTELNEAKHRQLLKPKTKLWSLGTKYNLKINNDGKFGKP